MASNDFVDVSVEADGTRDLTANLILDAETKRLLQLRKVYITYHYQLLFYIPINLGAKWIFIYYVI